MDEKSIQLQIKNIKHLKKIEKKMCIMWRDIVEKMEYCSWWYTNVD